MHPDFILFYTADPLKSAAFYSELLELTPVESAPTFVLFVLQGGMKLGLWLRDEVEPRAEAAPGAMEWALAVPGKAEVLNLFSLWQARGVPVAQIPTAMDFGFTFVVLDPDGHRIRVFAPNPE